MMKIRQPVFLAILVIIIAYTILYAPGGNEENFDLILRMYSADFRSVNPLLFSTFNLLGVWPMVYAVLVIEEAEAQPFPVWPFIILSFLMGGFIYLIYFSIRTPVNAVGPLTGLQKRVEKRRNMVLLFLVGLSLVLYGLIYGDLGGFVESFWSSGLVHVMSIDFVLISLLFPVLMKDDMIRKGGYSLPVFIILSVLSVIGALVYINMRLSKKNEN